jgi:hypothetical protein
LLGRCFTAWATPPAQGGMVYSLFNPVASPTCHIAEIFWVKGKNEGSAYLIPLPEVVLLSQSLNFLKH